MSNLSGYYRCYCCWQLTMVLIGSESIKSSEAHDRVDSFTDGHPIVFYSLNLCEV